MSPKQHAQRIRQLFSSRRLTTAWECRATTSACWNCAPCWKQARKEAELMDSDGFNEQAGGY